MQPPDGGADAWLCVLGYFLVCIGTLGVQYAYGTLYSELLNALGGSPGGTAFVGSLCAGLMDGLGAVSGIVISRIGSRRACVLGCFLSVSGTAASAAATRLWHLYLTYGLVAGVGQSLAFFAPIVLMPHWFSLRLARAHALANLGAALTPLVMGPVVPALVSGVCYI